MPLVIACATAVSANAIADALGIAPADRGTPFAGECGRPTVQKANLAGRSQR